MFYGFIKSGYTDMLAYVSAFISAIWIYVIMQYATVLPGYITSVHPAYGVAVAAFFGALLICKYICLDGNLLALSVVKAEKARLEGTVRNRDLTLAELQRSASAQESEIVTLRTKLTDLQENSPAKQMSELRIKLRASEEDKKSALSVLVKNLQSRISMMTGIQDTQLLYAVDVLRQEVGLVENELKRGEISYYELCIKIVDISEKLSELNEIFLVSSMEQPAKHESVPEIWLSFIRANDNSDPAAVERAFKFFKMAFHPDRFKSDSIKVEATRYFQHSINAHNAIKRMDRAAQ